MEAFPGHVENGVVVLEGGASLPEGTPVTVSCAAGVRRKPGKKKPVEFPLVRSKRPGSLHLTNQRIAKILEEEEVAGIRKFSGQGNS